MELQLPFTQKPSTAFMMAAAAGFVDVLGFVGIDKLFTAHVTGNIVIAISEMIHHMDGIVSKLVALPLFIIIAIVVTLCIEARGQRKGLLSFLFFLEALLLSGLMWGGLSILPQYSVTSLPYIGVGMLGVSAMAIHNTLLRTFMVKFPPCTVMTGNLTQLIVDVTSFTWGWKLPHDVEKRSQSHIGIKKNTNVLLGFLLGGSLSAFGYWQIGFWVMPVVIILLLWMAYLALLSR